MSTEKPKKRTESACDAAEDPYALTPRFVRFDVPLFEAVLAGRFKPAERQVALAVIGKTYDFKENRSGQTISVWNIMYATRLSDRAVKDALRALVRGGVLIEVAPRAGTRARILAIQPDPAKWGEFAPPPPPKRPPRDRNTRSPLDEPEGSKPTPETGTSVPHLRGASVPPIEEESKNTEDSSSEGSAAAEGAALLSEVEDWTFGDPHRSDDEESALTETEGLALVRAKLEAHRREQERAAMTHGLGIEAAS